MSRVLRLTTALVALALCGAVASPAAAQTATASLTATVVVDGVLPLTATFEQNLNFGVVVAGTPGTPASPANFGRILVEGENNAPVTFSWTLPTVLTRVGGAQTIPIGFNSTDDGKFFDDLNAVTGTYNPNVTQATALSATGRLKVGISGTVTPAATAISGTYEEQITLTVSYI